MTQNDLLSHIKAALEGPLENTHMAQFGLQARLNEDLYLDSLLMMQLLLQLELEHGLIVPETAIVSRSLVTVEDLVKLYAGESVAAAVTLPATSVHGEDYQDIKVHCVVSSLCHGLKRKGIDHRPFYFGVWDAAIDVGPDAVLRYHAPAITHDHFMQWFERLYGVSVVSWFDHEAERAVNAARLLELIERRQDQHYILAMVDMFLLPERENKFNQNPFPHYLMPQKGSCPDVFFVEDPDFRWEGEIARDTLMAAFCAPTVGGGWHFSMENARPAANEDISAYFLACFRAHEIPLITALRQIVDAHHGETAFMPLAHLEFAVREMPVILIRKYAYEHGFAFFWRALGWPDAGFDSACDAIEELIQTLRKLHFSVVRLSQTAAAEDAEAANGLLDRAERQERAIKHRLAGAFTAWRQHCGFSQPVFSPILEYSA